MIIVDINFLCIRIELKTNLRYQFDSLSIFLRSNYQKYSSTALKMLLIYLLQDAPCSKWYITTNSLKGI